MPRIVAANRRGIGHPTASYLPSSRMARQILRFFKKPRPTTAATYVQRVNLAIDHIVGHLHEPLRLRDLARVAMLSPFHLHRVFQALVGSTPADFVKRLRLEKALGLMWRDRSMSLTTIALGCGFSSSSDFSRCFRQRYGVPPVRSTSRPGARLTGTSSTRSSGMPPGFPLSTACPLGT